jgi:hypothetical protein
VDSGIVDINGNHTAQAYSFSFTPEPYFRIVASTPASGESLGVFQYVTLYVNSKVDTNIISKIHITPPVEGHWDLGFGDSLQIQFTPTGTFLNNLHYIFTIDKGAMDIAGNQMQVDNSVAFPTPSFHVKSTYPSDGNTNVYLSSGVTTRFNGPIDSATVPAAFSINPQLAGTFTYSITASISDFTNYIADFAFYPSSDFAPSTTYTVRVFSSLQSIDGTSIGQDYVFSFTTGDFAVYYWYPGYISSVSRSEKPHFYFTGRLDTASVRTAFSITPAVTGRIEFSSGDSFSFVPDSLLESHTEYTIIISTDLKSIGGYHLSKDNFYNFTTGS